MTSRPKKPHRHMGCVFTLPNLTNRVPVEMHVFHISSIVNPLITIYYLEEELRDMRYSHITWQYQIADH